MSKRSTHTMPLLKLSSAIAAFAVITCLISFSGTAYAAPAKKGNFTVMQPDGTVFSARIQGDEFLKIKTTSEGHAIRQKEDGFYYYACYDAGGSLVATDWKVGSKAPADVLSRSMDIPYSLLRQKAAEKRQKTAEIEAGKPNIMKRLRAASDIACSTSETEPAPANRHGIVILAQFKDLKFQFTRDNFVSMLTQNGYNYNGADGSAVDYFNDQFEGVFTFSFDVSSIVTLSENCAYYGGNDRNGDDLRPAEMIAEACRLADPEIDFSLYDDDGDGEVDNVFVFFAGGDEAEYAGDDRIWSHAWYVRDGAGINLTLDGKVINRYACTSELTRLDFTNYDMAGIGTFCHEFSHTLGLQDYYDTDYEGSGGQAEALWTTTALMDAGNGNNFGNTPPNYNAIDRESVGTTLPETISEEGTYTLEPIQNSGKYYRIDTDTEDEYFLLECRNNEGWDKYIGGSGLLIYHVDKSMNSAGHSESYERTFTASQRWVYNEINCNPAHQCAYIVKAYPNAGDVSQVFFPYEDSNSFTAYTTPAFTFWSGKSSYLAITNIHRDGDNIVFTVSRDTGRPAFATGINAEYYQDAAIISWSASDGVSGKAYVSIEGKGVEPEEKEVDAYESGKFSVTYEGLTPSTAYTVSIYFKKDELKGETEEIKFTTSAKRAMNYPFIYLKYVARNDDGSFPAGTKFPLRLFNATDADGIVWKYDGEEISTGKNGYFTPEKSGVMTAEIYYGDGSKDIVSKEIELK